MPAKKKAKILSYKQLMAKSYSFIDGLSLLIQSTLGQLTKNFIMLIWGESGNGKSNFIIQVLQELMKSGLKVLYISLEEGHEASMQGMCADHLSEEVASGQISFAASDMKFKVFLRQISPKSRYNVFVIDSVQYWDFDYFLYKELKEQYPNKTFIFNSHAKGRQPDGKTADKIRYDATIKVFVKGYIGFIKSRLRLDKSMPYQNFVIYEKGAKLYWGKKYKEKLTEIM